MTRMLVIVWNTEEQNKEKVIAELNKICRTVEQIGFERLDNIATGLNDRNAEHQISQRLATARHNNKKYYIIVLGSGAVLSKMVRMYADNLVNVTNGNFVELKNFIRHPEIVWGSI